MKESILFAWDLFLENLRFHFCFCLAFLGLVYYFDFLIWSLPLFLWTVFDAISSSTEEVLSIRPC